MGAAIGAGAVIAGGAIQPVVAGALSRRASREERAVADQDRLQAVLSLYKEPLAEAAFDLQARLFNILRGGVLARYHTAGTERQRAYIEASTLWRVARYFGWVEVLRREVQFLDLGDLEATRRVLHCQTRVRQAFQNDTEFGDLTFAVFADAQRAIGELVIAPVIGGGARPATLVGFAEFSERLASGGLDGWMLELREALPRLAKAPLGYPRIRVLQHRLIDLIEALEPAGPRFPEAELTRA